MSGNPVARRHRRPLFGAAAALLIAIGMSSVAFGQWRNQTSRSARNYATDESFDGKFQFCRIEFRQASNGDGGNWAVDYPRADQNLSVRLSELTKAPVSFDQNNLPNHLMLRLDQKELFRCSFIMMTEVGSVYLDDAEAENLRKYLLKGGFLWADDFWGEYAWAIWESQIRKALPSNAFQMIDLPLDHPIFHEVLNVDHFPQIPSIGGSAWRSGQTSERGADSATPHARAILDAHGRVMVLITHNTDFGDAYEREEDDPDYFRTFSVIGYAFGINTLIYSMTH
jgi:hypothetical protein